MSATTTPATGGPTTNIRLYLRAVNLPKSIISQQPDTLARISLLLPESDSPHLPPDGLPHTGGDGEDHDSMGGGENEEPSPLHEKEDLQQTEVVYKSSNPKWTASFTAEYEFGTQLLFFVDIFALKGRGSIIGAAMGKGCISMTHLGRAVYDVRDVLGSMNHIKARRLRKGGVVYAHIDQLSSSSITTAPRTRSLSFAAPSDGRILNLRLRADSLCSAHSITNKVASIRSKPNTFYEISLPSSGMVVYRSPTVKECVTPTWDGAMVELSSLCSASTSALDDLSTFPIKISVYKLKMRKCKEMGSFETTVQSLVDACQAKATATVYENEQYEDEQSMNRDQQSFQLRPPARGVEVSEKVTGNITIVKASVEQSCEVMKRSQRFLSETNEIDNTDDTRFGEVSRGFGDANEGDLPPSMNPSLTPQSQPNFSDYVSAGILDMDFCVAIDFTSSNGDPRIPGTQHYSRDGMMNDYEEAISALSSTIEKYSSTQEYPVWGFGAKYGGIVQHIFQCGDSKTAKGTEGILDAYRAVFETDLIMSGPSEISSVLKQAAHRSKQYLKAPLARTNMQYCVLMILTDGMVKDLAGTKELVRLYKRLKLPLSVIVVGIGRADFTEFHQWNQLPSDDRGCFQFVEFREHQFDPDTLSRKALSKVPQEVVDYFMNRDVRP